MFVFEIKSITLSLVWKFIMESQPSVTTYMSLGDFIKTKLEVVENIIHFVYEFTYIEPKILFKKNK